MEAAQIPDHAIARAAEMIEASISRPAGAAMSAEDAERWRSARTLADLGELTALFLEGEIEQTPTHMGPPDSETASLVPVLAAANRAGFVTENSQPGMPPSDYGAQRACVSGYADDATFALLCTAVASADLIMTAARAGVDDWPPSVNVTLDGVEELTWDGGAQCRRSIEYLYGGLCHSDAVSALTKAWQISLIDPEWGRNDVLWQVLADFRHNT